MKIKYSRVKSIKEVKVDKTYDFAVTDEHKIIARQEGSENSFYTSNCWHPDVEEFITSKQTPGRLTKFNMSLLVSDALMEAVKTNSPWNLEFPDYETHMTEYENDWDGNLDKWKEAGLTTTIYKTFDDANELWDLIMDSTYNRNEPGILFPDTMNKMNNLHYCEHISATNPCVVADTKVAVANGQDNVTIGELAKIGEDVPVYCLNDNGKLVVRTMRAPRVTGYNEPIYKVTIENGHEVRVTGNHKFKLKSGEYKEAKDLVNGDSLYIMNKFDASFWELYGDGKKTKKQDYKWFRVDGQKAVSSEHRMVAASYNNVEIPKGHVVHHIDYDAGNNAPENLRIMTTDDHIELHKQDMVGDKNPMRRAATEWSEEKWSNYRENMSNATSGESNGRFSGITEEDFRNLALELTSELGRRFSTKEWTEFCESKGKKYTYTKWRERKLGSIKGLGKWATLKLGYDEFMDFDPRIVKYYKKWTSEGYDCRIEHGGLKFIKECEICENEFDTLNREHSICSLKCGGKRTSERNKNQDFIDKCTEGQRKHKAIYKEESRQTQMKIYSDLKFELSREPMRAEWEQKCKSEKVPYRVGKTSPFKNYGDLKEHAVNYNHKVISVELDGHEDVYNGTVDEFHNFFVGEFDEMGENGKRNSLYINNLNCGEQLLPIGGVCLLGSINLTQFVDFKNKSWDYKKLKEIIPTAIRFMDNVNDITNVPLDSQKENLKDKRRIGLGIMGYGSALMMLKIRYGSKKAIDLTEELMSFIMNEAYLYSSIIAKEKGSFGLYDEKEYLSGNFIKGLDKKTTKSIKKNGIRNSHLLSIQPTGNSSIFANVVSGGLEPVFMPEYVRTSMMPFPPDGLYTPENVDWENKNYVCDTDWTWIKEGDENLLTTEFEDYTWKYDKSRGLLRETTVKDYAVRFLEKRNQWKPEAKWAGTTTELDIKEHVSTMEVLAKYIDSAMSKCVVKGTLLTTNKGIIPIEDIGGIHKSTDSFITPNGDYEIMDENGELKSITNHYYGGEKDCYKITFKNGFEIECAYTHKFKTEEGWKSVLDLVDMDKVYFRNPKMDNNEEYVQVTEKPDFKNSIIRDFPTEVDENYAKFLGMLISDGSINDNTISIVENNEVVGIEFKWLIKKLFNLTSEEHIDTDNGNRYNNINSKSLSGYYYNLIGTDNITKTIPDYIMESNDSVKNAFIEGLSLEGYLKEDEHLVAYEGYSKEVAVKTSYILNSLGYDYYLGSKEVKTGRLSYMVKAYLTDKEIQPIEEHKYEYGYAGGDQDQDQDQVLVNESEKYNTLPNTRDDNRLSYIPIENIEHIGKREVYDIEVEDTHSYLINGFVSHNTVNIPNDYPYEKFKNLYADLHNTGSVKGGTTYRAGTMTEVLASTKDNDKDNDSEITGIEKTTAPHRNKSMDCGIYHVTAQGQKWIVIVGLMGEDPYEIFAFKPKFIHLPTSITEGKLTKVKRCYYNLECENGLVIENISDNFETDEQEALTRMISTALRHGADIQFVFEQLNKSEGTITSFSKAIGRTLKRYLKDGSESSDVCGECQSENSMVYQESCLICKNCGWSKC